MAHSYSKLNQWNEWLSQHYLGESLLRSQEQLLNGSIKRQLGKHVLLIGVSNQHSLLKSTSMPCQSILSPLRYHLNKVAYIEGNLHDLPLLTGSIDLVLLPHTLELVDNPRQLLAETCRIIKPEGLIVIFGFNPYSAWGIRRSSNQKNKATMGNLMQANEVKTWLKLADFSMEQESWLMFRPPLSNPELYKKLLFMEKIGKRLLPFLGGVYMLIARAKVYPLTPIRMKWTQQLNGIRIPTRISSPSIRI